MAPFPIVGRFVGDFFPCLVAVDTRDTMDEVAAKVAVHSVGKRVAARPGSPGYDVFLDGRRLEPTSRFDELDVLPLQWLDVRFRD